MRGCGQALRACRAINKKSGRQPEEYALHSLRIGFSSMLAAGGNMSERVTQREGRWKSDACKVYTRNYADDAGQFARKLAAGEGLQKQTGQGTAVWGKLL